MSSSAFSKVRARQSSHSDHPKTVVNRQIQSRKAGLDIALTRADANYRVRKSRELNRLHEGIEWPILPEATRRTIEEDLLEKLAAERNAKKQQLELTWLKRHEEDDIAEEENDGWIKETTDADVEDETDGSEDDDENTAMLGNEEEEWNGIKSDDDLPDSDSLDEFDTFITDVAAIKKKSGEGWMEKIKLIEEKAKEKAAQSE